VRPMPRTRPQGTRPVAEHRRPLAELHVSSALRLPSRRTNRRVEPADGAGVSNLEQQDMLAIVAYLAARSAGPQLKLETSGCGPNRCRALPFSPARRVRAARGNSSLGGPSFTAPGAGAASQTGTWAGKRLPVGGKSFKTGALKAAGISTSAANR
jgi:hypothetical protein